MSQSSKIEWTDATWNPVRGCSRVSPGCVNCYAETMAARNLPEMRSPTTEEAFAIRTPSGPRWTGKVEVITHKLDEPLHWKKPRRVFVNSMSDLFHEALTIEEIARPFCVMAEASQHDFQVLTKRGSRMPEVMHAIKPIVAEAWERFDGGRFPWPLPNVWLGVSVEDQQRADERIPLLLQTPAAVRFVSYEPALGPVDYLDIRLGNGAYVNALTGWRFGPVKKVEIPHELRGLDWVIVGGESGPGARPFDVQWARNTIAQCKAAGVACFVKQLGAQAFCGKCRDAEDLKRCSDCATDTTFLAKTDRKGGDWSEWPDDLRVREFPAPAVRP